jgi:hypothetical protein
MDFYWFVSSLSHPMLSRYSKVKRCSLRAIGSSSFPKGRILSYLYPSSRP